MRSGSWHCYLEPSRNPANTPALPWDPAHHRGLSNHPVAGLPSDSRTLHVLYLAELQGHFLATCPGSMLGTEVAPGSSWRHRAEPLPVPPSFSMQRCWEHSCYCHSWRRLTWGHQEAVGFAGGSISPRVGGGGWGAGLRWESPWLSRAEEGKSSYLLGLRLPSIRQGHGSAAVWSAGPLPPAGVSQGVQRVEGVSVGPPPPSKWRPSWASSTVPGAPVRL